LVVVLASCAGGEDLPRGPEARTVGAVLDLFEDVGLSCGDDADPMGDGPGDAGECAPLGTGVRIEVFADDDE
jgi:hypothetical protein